MTTLKPKKPNLQECRERIATLEAEILRFRCAFAWQYSNSTKTRCRRLNDSLGGQYTLTLVIGPKAYCALVIVEFLAEGTTIPSLNVHGFDEWHIRTQKELIYASDDSYKKEMLSVLDTFRQCYDTEVTR